MELKAMIWKELKDLSRDRKTLFTAVLLPAIMLPLMAELLVLAIKTAPITVVVVNLDKGGYAPVPTLIPGQSPLQKVNVGDELVRTIEEVVKRVSANARVVVYREVPKRLPNFNVLVIIPSNFTSVLMNLDPNSFKQAVVEVYYRAGPSGLGMGATTVYQAVINVIRLFSKNFAEQRVAVLLGCCNATNTTPIAVLSPIEVKTQYVSAAGKPVSAAELGRMMSAKLLLFSIFYVTVPVLAFISDSVAGEKERKTLETLLASPIKRRNVVLGKFAASLTLGAVAAVADIIGLILYLQIINTQIATAAVASAQYAVAMKLTLDPRIVALHGFVMLLVVASTAALLMPIVSLTDSVRSAQSIGGAVQMIPLLIILYAMYSDINSLPLGAKVLAFMLPHTYAVLAIDYALKGSWIGVAESVAAMLAITGALLWVTTKIFESEVLITGFGRKRK